MTAALLLQPLTYREVDNNGNPLAFGTIQSFQGGTNTPTPTFTDSTGITPNANPLTLNSRGEAQIWVPPNVSYKFLVKDSAGNQIRVVDQVAQTQLVTLYGGVDTGVANAYVLNFPASFSSYNDGLLIYWVPSHSNSGPSTVNINSLGVVSIISVSGTPLGANSIVANQVTWMIFKGSQFTLLSLISSLGSNVVINAPSSGSSLTVNGAPGFNSGTFVGDTSLLDVANSSLFPVLRFGTVFAWNATGSTTDAAIGAAKSLSIFVNDSNFATMVINTAGNVAISAPTSGAALTVNGLSSGIVVASIAGNTTGIPVQFMDISSTANIANQTACTIGVSFSALTGLNGDLVLSPRTSGGNSIYFYTGSGTPAQRFQVGPNGNVTINPPVSGTALAVNAAANARGITILGSSTTGQSYGLFMQAGTNSSDQAFGINNFNNTATYLTVRGDGNVAFGGNGSAISVGGVGAGNVIINAPPSGTTLTVTGANIANQPAIAVSQGSITQTSTTAVGLAMNSAGPHWGVVENTGSTTWCLGYSTTSNTTGTAVLSWSDTGDITARGIDIAKIKAASTNRNTTTTATADPDLQYAIPAAGTYRYKADLYFNAGASGATPGMKVGVFYTGTVSNTNPWNGVGFTGGAAFANGGPAVNFTTNLSVDTGTTDSLSIEGTVVVSTTGTLSVAWAQQNSSGTNTTMLSGSSFMVEQLS